MKDWCNEKVVIDCPVFNGFDDDVLGFKTSTLIRFTRLREFRPLDTTFFNGVVARESQIETHYVW